MASARVRFYAESGSMTADSGRVTSRYTTAIAAKSLHRSSQTCPEDFERPLEKAREFGLKVMTDQVLSQTSVAHEKPAEGDESEHGLVRLGRCEA
jgi:hypothetical protein